MTPPTPGEEAQEAAFEKWRIGDRPRDTFDHMMHDAFAAGVRYGRAHDAEQEAAARRAAERLANEYAEFPQMARHYIAEVILRELRGATEGDV